MLHRRDTFLLWYSNFSTLIGRALDISNESELDCLKTPTSEEAIDRLNRVYQSFDGEAIKFIVLTSKKVFGKEKIKIGEWNVDVWTSGIKTRNNETYGDVVSLVLELSLTHNIVSVYYDKEDHSIKVIFLPSIDHQTNLDADVVEHCGRLTLAIKRKYRIGRHLYNYEDFIPKDYDVENEIDRIMYWDELCGEHFTDEMTDEP